MLCLKHYEDWTFRETEVRLREPRELRRVLELRSVPDYTTLYPFLKRLEEETIHQPMSEVARRFPAPDRSRRRARVAVDATGLAQGAIRTFFVRRQYHHPQRPLPWRHWLKWLAVVDLDRQLIVAQRARRGPWNDCAHLPA